MSTNHRPHHSEKCQLKIINGSSKWWAKGQTAGGVPTGYWKRFRKDGSLMRSGMFKGGMQFGKWTTYD